MTNRTKLKKKLWVCSTCREELPAGSFGKNYAKTKREVGYRCNGCMNRKAKEYYQNNIVLCREKARAKHWKHRDRNLLNSRKYGQRLKAEIFEHYGESVCACCGETEKIFLTLDHVNGGGNEHRRNISAGGYGIYRWLRNNNFPEGYQILCFNCNSGKALNGGICPHEEIQKDETQKQTVEVG